MKLKRFEEFIINENIQDKFKSGTLSEEEKQDLKKELPSKSIDELQNDERDVKIGDILMDGDGLYYRVTENNNE